MNLFDLFKVSKELLTYTNPYNKKQMLNFLILLFCIIVTMLYGLSVKSIVDQGIKNKDTHSLTLYTMCYLGVIISAYVLNLVKDYITALLTESIMKDFRYKIFHTLNHIGLDKQNEKNLVGTFLTAIINDVNVIGDYYSRIIVQTSVNFIYVIATGFFLYYWSPPILTVCIFFIPIIYLLILFFNKNIFMSSLEQREQLEKMNCFVQQYCTDIKGIMFFEDRPLIDKYLIGVIETSKEKNLKSIFWQKFSAQTIKYVSQIPLVFIYLWGGSLIIHGNQNFTIGKLLAIVLYVEMFMAGINVISSNIMESSKSMISVKKILQLLELSELKKIEDQIINSRPPETGPFIQLKDITIKAGKKVLFQNFNALFTLGHINVIQGKNGAGKSSLVFYLLGIKCSESGVYLLNGCHIKWPYTLGINRFISVSFQDRKFFDVLTVKESLGSASSHSSFNDYCNRFNFDIKKHEKTLVSHLSGGEKQKISLINTLCSSNEILIFDEPTNHLDRDSIHHFVDIIEKIKYHKLIIVISHEKEIVSRNNNLIML